MTLEVTCPRCDKPATAHCESRGCGWTICRPCAPGKLIRQRDGHIAGEPTRG